MDLSDEVLKIHFCPRAAEKSEDGRSWKLKIMLIQLDLTPTRPRPGLLADFSQPPTLTSHFLQPRDQNECL